MSKCVICDEPLSIIEKMIPFNPKICSTCTEKEIKESKKEKKKKK